MSNSSFTKKIKKLSDAQLIKQLKYFRKKDEDKYEAIVDEIDFRGIAESIQEALDSLNERKIITKVNFRGQRRKKVQCPKGKVSKNVNGKVSCVTPSGSDKMTKRLAIKKSVRTKKAKGTGFKRRTNFKRQRAIKKRKGMGLK